MHVQGLTESDVATIGQGRDDQSLRTTEELVLVGKVDVRYGDDTGVHFLQEIGSRLLRPFEIFFGLDSQFTLKHTAVD